MNIRKSVEGKWIKTGIPVWSTVIIGMAILLPAVSVLLPVHAFGLEPIIPGPIVPGPIEPVPVKLPDLIISAGGTASPTTVAPGDQITFSSYTVKNQGNGAAGTFRVTCYGSTDSVITNTDLLLCGGADTVSSLAAGATYTRAAGIKITIPATTAPGTYYVGFLADYQSSVSEWNESNNYKAVPITVTAPPKPDLVITSGAPTATPDPAIPGEPLRVSSYTVKNSGAVASGSYRVGFYLSVDTTLNSGDYFLGYTSLALGLNPGASRTTGGTTITQPVPAIAPGGYYLIILVDVGNDVAESNEANNTVSAHITVGEASVPDLVITTGATATPSTVAAGGTVTLSTWSVKNEGTASSGPFNNGYYLSSDAVITTADTFLSENSNTSLSPGAERDWGGPTLAIPADTSPGTYYIGILVDSDNDVAESDENNNYVSSMITVTEAVSEMLPLPLDVEYYVIPTRELPLVTYDASTCDPIGVGNPDDGVLSMRIGLPLMEAAVDVYFALYSESLSTEILLITEDNTIVPFSGGLVPWRANVLGPIDEPIFGDIPTFFLPAGTYYLFLAVTPAGAGNLDDMYLWGTSFDIVH